MYIVTDTVTGREIHAQWVHYGVDGNVWYKEAIGGCTVKCSVEPKIKYIRTESKDLDELGMITYMNGIANEHK